jgi:hypothetical protein
MDWESWNAKAEISGQLLEDFTFAEDKGEVKQQNSEVMEIFHYEVLWAIQRAATSDMQQDSEDVVVHSKNLNDAQLQTWLKKVSDPPQQQSLERQIQHSRLADRPPKRESAPIWNALGVRGLRILMGTYRPDKTTVLLCERRKRSSRRR